MVTNGVCTALCILAFMLGGNFGFFIFALLKAGKDDNSEE